MTGARALMRPPTRSAERLLLLENAIRLMEDLASVFVAMGPNGFGPICSPTNDPEGYAHIKTLETALHVKTQGMLMYRNTALSASTRLPDDVLRYIFELAMPVRDRARDTFDGTITLPPVTFQQTITQVCRRWRHVALNSASLWAPVRLRVPNRQDKLAPARRHPQYRRFVQTTLSKQYRFHIQQSQRKLMDVYLPLNERPMHQRVVDDFIKKCAPRTRGLVFDVVPSPGYVVPSAAKLDIPRAMIECIGASKNTLKSLELAFPVAMHEYSEEKQSVWRQILQFDCPQLTDVVLRRLVLTGTKYKIPLVSHCRRLEISISYRPFTLGRRGIQNSDLSFLAHCTQLRELWLTLGECRGDAELPPRVLLPNLERLELIVGPADHIAWLMNGLKTPRLNHLGMTARGGPKQRHPEGLRDAWIMLSNESEHPVLRSLHARELTTSYFAAMLTSVSSTLNELSLINSWLQSGDQLYGGLALLDPWVIERNHGISSTLCPSLSVLKLGFAGLFIHFKRLIELCKARKSIAKPLRKLIFSDWVPESSLTEESARVFPHISEQMIMEEELASLVDELIVGDWRYCRYKREWVLLH